MPKRINWTGRRRLRREDVRIILEAGSEPAGFRVELNLDRYGLPPNASVMVEAERGVHRVRFPHGTVEAPRPAEGRPCRLGEFDTVDGVTFCVKVVDVAGRPGVILAEVDGLRPFHPGEEAGSVTPLLPVVVKPLEEEAWRLDFSGQEVLLEVSDRAGGKALSGLPVFRSLVFPGIVREVLTRILEIEKCFDVEEDDWRGQWLRFAVQLTKEDVPQPRSGTRELDPDAAGDWIAGVVRRFSMEHRLVSRLPAQFLPGGGR